MKLSITNELWKGDQQTHLVFSVSCCCRSSANVCNAFPSLISMPLFSFASSEIWEVKDLGLGRHGAVSTAGPCLGALHTQWGGQQVLHKRHCSQHSSWWLSLLHFPNDLDWRDLIAGIKNNQGSNISFPDLNGLQNCCGSAAFALLHAFAVSITDTAWPNLGSSAVAQGDFADVPYHCKPAGHKGQLLSTTKIKWKKWASPSVLLLLRLLSAR